jgi:hypothetical protein
MKYAELLTSHGLCFLVAGQVLILKVTLALSMIQAASFDAFTRHNLSKKCATHLPKHFRRCLARPKESQSRAGQNSDKSIQML